MHTSTARINNALALALGPVAASLAEREAERVKTQMFLARMKAGKERKARVKALQGRVHGHESAITRLHS